jgi:hypothetical protein
MIGDNTNYGNEKQVVNEGLRHLQNNERLAVEASELQKKLAHTDDCTMNVDPFEPDKNGEKYRVLQYVCYTRTGDMAQIVIVNSEDIGKH